MPVNENRNERSQSVQALLSSPLQWPLRWGTLLIISILLFLAGLLSFINYTDTLPVKMLVLKQQNASTLRLICTKDAGRKIKPGSKIKLDVSDRKLFSSGVITKVNALQGKGFAIIDIQLDTKAGGTNDYKQRTACRATITLNKSTLYNKLLGKN